MDRIEFVNKINKKNDNTLHEIVIQYFHEVMCLYDLVVLYKNINQIEGPGESSLSFELEFINNEDASKLHSEINGKIVSKYNHTFSITSVLNNNIISIQLS